MGMALKMSLSSCVILLMLVSNSYAKSLILNDVPDPPKKSSFRLPLVRAALFAREHYAKKSEEPVSPNDENTLATNTLHESKRAPFSAMYESSMKIHDAPQLLLPVIKFQSLKRDDHPQKDETFSQRGEHGGKRFIIPDKVKDNQLKLRDEEATTVASTIISTKVPVVTTAEATTVIPTVVPTVTKIPATTVTAEQTTTVTAEPTTAIPATTSKQTTTAVPTTIAKQTTTAVPTTTAKQTTTAIPTTTAKQTTTAVPTTTTTIKTTTEDPWDAFCDEACQEGLAGPECDCAEHPIGRRNAQF